MVAGADDGDDDDDDDEEDDDEDGDDGNLAWHRSFELDLIV